MKSAFFDVGEFGDVYKGKLTKPNKKKITVAVKTLKVVDLIFLLLSLGSFLFSTCLCFAKVSPEFARPSLWRDLYIGKISILDRMCPGVCPHFRGTITIKAEISEMRGEEEKLCYAYAWFHFATEFLLDFYKNWNNFTGKLWLYFFLLIYVKVMTLLAFIVLEGNHVLLCLCR